VYEAGIVNVRHGKDSVGLGLLASGSGVYSERFVLLIMLFVMTIDDDRWLNRQRDAISRMMDEACFCIVFCNLLLLMKMRL